VPYLTFRYTVIRLWQEPLAPLLAAGPGIAPLALLTNEAAADLPAAFGRFQQRMKADNLPVSLERSLIGSTFVLCGLRYPPAQVEAIYRNLSMTLEDSTTYQLILNRGEARGAQALLLSAGARRFGAPDATTEATIRAIADRDRLDRFALRLSVATDWSDLLSTP
jgi:hypothetical protein